MVVKPRRGAKHEVDAPPRRAVRSRRARMLRRYRPTPVGFPSSSRASMAMRISRDPFRRAAGVEVGLPQPARASLPGERARPRQPGEALRRGPRRPRRTLRSMAAAKPSTSAGSSSVPPSPTTSGSDPRFDDDHRNPRRHRLERRQPEPFVERRHHQRPGSGIQPLPIMVRDVAEVLDVAAQRRAGRDGRATAPRRRGAAGQDQPGRRREPAAERAHRRRAACRRSCVASSVPTNRKYPSARRVRRVSELTPRRRAERADVDALCGHAELARRRGPACTARASRSRAARRA